MERFPKRPALLGEVAAGWMLLTTRLYPALFSTRKLWVKICKQIDSPSVCQSRNAMVFEGGAPQRVSYGRFSNRLTFGSDRIVDGTVLYRWEAIGDALQQEHLTQAERAALLKVLQEMGYESEQRQEELYHDLVELLLESNGTVWGAVHLAELEQGFQQLGEQPPKGYQAFAAAMEAGLLRRYGDDLETYHALAERYGVLTAHSLFPIAEMVGIQPDHLLADPMYAGLLNQLTGTAAANALSTEKILQLLEQHPAKRELAVALLEFLALEKDLNSFGLSVKDVFDQHSNPYRIFGEEGCLQIYQEKHQLVRNIRFELDKVERMRDYLEQKRKESGGSLVRNGKEWTRQDLAYYRMVGLMSILWTKKVESLYHII